MISLTEASRLRRSRRSQTLRALCCLLAAVGTWLVSPAQANAQKLDDALAQSLKEQGDAALVAGRFTEAEGAYRRALAIEPSPILHYNRGRALQALARYAEALDELQAFEATALPELRAKVPRLADLSSSLRAQVTELRVSCAIAGARVQLGPRLLGTTPLPHPLRVDVGQQTLRVEADGYSAFVRQLSLRASAPSSVTVLLLRPDESGLLRVRSVPGSKVWVDDQLLGQAPAETRVPAGRHMVRVEHPGYETNTGPVVVLGGESRLLEISLAARPGLLQKWWFWTGAGVLAAATAVSVVALTTERSPGTGSIPPGAIAAPLVRFQ